MKKLAAIFLALIFALLPLTAYAQAEAPAETKIMMGDVTNDRKVSAADARRVLRMAASIESKDGVSMLAADADANGRITAADARLILRVSAKIEPFSCGFDADGNLNAVNVIKSGVYSMDAAILDDTLGGTGEFPISIVFNGSDFCLKFTGGLSDGGSADMGEMGVLFKDGKTYAITSINGVNMAITEESLMLIFGDDEEMLEDLSVIINMANFMNIIITDDMGIPQKITENGGEYFVYNYPVTDGTATLKADAYGNIVNIAIDDGDLKIAVKSLSGVVSSGAFNIDDYILF